MTDIGQRWTHDPVHCGSVPYLFTTTEVNPRPSSLWFSALPLYHDRGEPTTQFTVVQCLTSLPRQRWTHDPVHCGSVPYLFTTTEVNPRPSSLWFSALPLYHDRGEPTTQFTVVQCLTSLPRRMATLMWVLGCHYIIFWTFCATLCDISL